MTTIREQQADQVQGGACLMGRCRDALPDKIAHLIFWPIALAGLVLDLWTKQAVFAILRREPDQSLAIIDGFLVGTGSEQYVIPLAQVVECVEIAEDNDVHRQGHHYINLRGEVLPYLRLKDFFDIKANGGGERESLVVVRFGHTKAGLVVDELFGELQTVIKPLGQIFEHLKGVAGATVLGTGEIALILDVQELTALMHGREHAQAAQLAH